MIQRHTIILWKKAENKTFEKISGEAYKVLDLLQDYPQELRPNYLTAASKKDIREFVWNYENFSRILKNGINKEGENVFEDLGYSVSFFSSMVEENSCSILMQAGNKNEKFYNTLLIDLPLSFDLYDEKTADKIRCLFKSLVEAYKPYWGCISNKVLSRKYGRFLEGNMPVTLHWMNYWSEDIICMTGMKKIQKIVDENANISFQDGILSISNIALDANKEEEIRYLNKLQKQLFLHRLSPFSKL